MRGPGFFARVHQKLRKLKRTNETERENEKEMKIEKGEAEKKRKKGKNRRGPVLPLFFANGVPMLALRPPTFLSPYLLTNDQVFLIFLSAS